VALTNSRACGVREDERAQLLSIDLAVFGKNLLAKACHELLIDLGALLIRLPRDLVGVNDDDAGEFGDLVGDEALARGDASG
jgi:hypothetical protein